MLDLHQLISCESCSCIYVENPRGCPACYALGSFLEGYHDAVKLAARVEKLEGAKPPAPRATEEPSDDDLADWEDAVGRTVVGAWTIERCVAGIGGWKVWSTDGNGKLLCEVAWAQEKATAELLCVAKEAIPRLTAQVRELSADDLAVSMKLQGLARGWMDKAHAQVSKGADLSEDGNKVGSRYRFGHASAMSDCAITLAQAIGYELDITPPKGKG